MTTKTTTLMKRVIVMSILKMSGKIITLTMINSLVIGIIGYMNRWETSIKYSNAFFLAGCFMIIAGTSARMAANQAWKSFQLIHAESFHGMSGVEQVNFIVGSSSPLSLVFLGLLSGTLLILISVFVTKIF